MPKPTETFTGLLSDVQKRVAVVATSAVTLLSGVAVTVTTFSTEIASAVPVGWSDDVTKVSLVVTTWLATAIAALRRVAPVEKGKRGVLPK